jgi:hypothetical protein
VFPSMTGRGQACQEGRPGAGEALAGLAWFRREFRRCLWLRPDALFELTDAVLTAPGLVPSLPYLSLEPAFRRGHGMIYQALSEGGIDEEALRDLLAAARPRDWPAVFAIDASTYPRPAAETSPGREWHHHSCPGHHGRGRESRRSRDGDAVAAGWSFQWLAQLSFEGGSWTAPQDQARAGAGADASLLAAGQILAHAARLRADGESRIPLYVMDAAYDAASVTADVRDHPVQVLIRLRNDRVFYRDPPPRVPGQAGRPRIHGSGSDRFACKDPATWGPPDRELSLDDGRYGQVSVMSWGGLHPKLYCRGRFAGWKKPPVIRCHLIRVTVTRLPGRRKVPGPLWLWWAGPEGTAPDPDLCWRAYLHRFRYRARLPVRQARPGLGQGRPPLPGAGLALDLADHRRPHHAPAGPPGRRRPPAALGTPPPPRQAHPRPGPPRFRSPGHAGRHARQAAKTLKTRPRTAQRPHQHPRNQVPSPQESSLKSRERLKRKVGDLRPKSARQSDM